MLLFDVDGEEIAAQAELAPKPARPDDLVVAEEAGVRLLDLIVEPHLQDLPRRRVVETGVGDVVVADLQAHCVLDAPPPPVATPGPFQLAALDETTIDLLELIAVGGVVERVGEVRPEVQPVIEAVEQQRGGRAVAAPGPVERERCATSLPAVGLIDGAEAADEPLADRPLRHLIGGMPQRRPVGAPGQVEGVAPVIPVVAQERVVAVGALGQIPRTVVVVVLDGVEQRARTDRGAVGQERPRVAELTELHVGDPLGERAHLTDVGRTGAREVADLRVEGTLFEIDGVDQLGDQEVEI